MAVKLGGEVRASLEQNGEEVVFTFREPTNGELNQFLSDRFSMRGKKTVDRSVNKRVELFDLLLTKVENLEGADGNPITAENREKIPVTWKNAVILDTFENKEVTVKN